MTLEGRKDGSRRHTHSGLAAVRPHSVDLGPVNHSSVQTEQAPEVRENGVSLKPDMPNIAKSIDEVRAFRTIHGVKPPVQHRF